MPSNSDQLETVIAEASAAPALTLLRPVREGTDAPVVQLNRAVTLIGSRSTARVHLQSSTVSKAHCLVVITPNGAFVRDLLSRQGTQVNGDDAVEHDLVDGDEITVGRFTFLFNDPRTLPAKAEQVAVPEAVILKMAIGDQRPTKPVGDRRVILIGRRPGSDVVLDDPRVSTAHAAIVRFSGGEGSESWAIFDLGGKGTQFNGKPLTRARMGRGDIAAIGPALMRLSFTKPEKLAKLETLAEVARPLETTIKASASPVVDESQGLVDELVDETEEVPHNEQLLDEAGLEDVFDDAVESVDDITGEVTDPPVDEAAEEIEAEEVTLVSTAPAIEEIADEGDVLVDEAVRAKIELLDSPIVPPEATRVDEVEEIEEIEDFKEESLDFNTKTLATVHGSNEPQPLETFATPTDVDERLASAAADECADTTADRTIAQVAYEVASSPTREPQVLFGGDAADDAGVLDLSRIAFDAEAVNEADALSESTSEDVSSESIAEAPLVPSQPASVDPRRKGRRGRRLNDPIGSSTHIALGGPLARDAAEFAGPTPVKPKRSSGKLRRGKADPLESNAAAIPIESQAAQVEVPLDAPAEAVAAEFALDENPSDSSAGSTLPATESTPASAFPIADLGQLTDADLLALPQSFAPADDSFAAADTADELPDDESFLEQITGLSDSLTGELVDTTPTPTPTATARPAEIADFEEESDAQSDSRNDANGDTASQLQSETLPGWRADWQTPGAAHFDIGTPISLSPVPEVSPWGPGPVDLPTDATSETSDTAHDAPSIAASAERADDVSAGHDSGLPTPYGHESLDVGDIADDPSSAPTAEAPPEGWLDSPGTSDAMAPPAIQPRPRPLSKPGSTGPRQPPRPVRVGFGGGMVQGVGADTASAAHAVPSGPFSSTSLPGTTARSALASASWSLDPSTVIPEASGLVGAADVFGFDPPTALMGDESAEPAADMAGAAGNASTSPDFEEDLLAPPTGSFLQTIREGVRPHTPSISEHSVNGHANGHVNRHSGGHSNGHVNAHTGSAVAEELPRVRPARPAPRRPRAHFDRRPVLVAEPLEDVPAPRSRGVRLISLLGAMLLVMVGAFIGVQTLMAPTTDVTLLVRYATPEAMSPEQLADLHREQLRRVYSDDVRREAVASLARSSPALDPGWLTEATSASMATAEGDTPVAGSRSFNARIDDTAQRPMLMLTTTTQHPADDAKRLLALGAAMEDAGGVERAKAEALDQSIRDDELTLTRLDERLVEARSEVEVAQAELAAPAAAPEADPETLQARIDEADSEWAQESEQAARLKVQLEELEATEVGLNDPVLDKLRGDLIDIETQLMEMPPNAADLREQSAEVRRGIAQREAELQGQRLAETQSLRRDIATAEMAGQQARLSAQQTRSELSAVEASNEQARRRQQQLGVMRNNVSDIQTEKVRVSGRLITNNAQRNNLAYPEAVLENNLIRLTEPDERFKYMIVALVGVFALFLIPIYFTLRSPGF